MALLDIDNALLAKASDLTGVKEMTALVRYALENLIAIEASRRLARLSASEPMIQPIRRRRTTGS